MAVLAIAATGAMAGGWALGSTGAAIGWAVGAYVGQLLFGEQTKIEGPRLENLTVQTSALGASIAKVYGSVRVAGNVFWSLDLIEKKTEESGGKGGGPEITTYSYFATFAVGLAEGEIIGVRKIWLDGKLFADFSGDDFFDLQKSQEQVGDYFTVYKGTETQGVDPVMEAEEGAGNMPAYRGLAYIVFDELPLANYGNRLPNVSAEVVAAGSESNQNWIFNTPTNDPWGIAVTKDGTLISTEAQPPSIFVHDGILANTVNEWLIDDSVYTWIEDVTVLGGNLYSVRSKTGVGNVICKHDGISPRILWEFEPSLPYANGICNNGTDLFIAINHPTIDRIDWLTGDGGDPEDPQYTGYIPSLAKEHSQDLWGICIDDDGNLIESTRSGTGMLYRHVGLTGEEKDSLDLYTPHGIDDVEAVEWYDGKLIVIAQNYNQIWVFDGFTSQVITVTSIIRATPSLQTVLDDICESCGVTSGLRDTSDCSSINIKGFVRAMPMSGRQALEPLMMAYKVDAAEVDHKIKFIKRGNSSAVSIPADDLAAHESGVAMPDEISIRRNQEVEFPREVNVSYLNRNRDYQQGLQRSIRMTANSKTVKKIEFPLVLTNSEGKKAAEVLHSILDVERVTYRFATKLKYLEYAPCEVIEVNGMLMRISGMNIFGNLLQIEGPAEMDGTYNSYADAEDPDWQDQKILWRGPTAFVFLDIPILRDEDNDAGFYVAAHGFYTGWGGASLYISYDGGGSWAEALTIDTAAVMGFTSDALGDGPAGIWDRKNTVNIALSNNDAMSLSSITEAAVLNGGNAAAIGSPGNWEIIQFANATLETDGTYTLDTLLRGRRGSEGATGGHAAGDYFVLLQTGALGRFKLGVDQIGNTYQYKVATWGQHLQDVGAYEFKNNSVGLECYAVADVRGARDGTNNLTITWKRRTRIGGEWRDNVGIKLGEDSENYEIDVYDNGNIVRTIQVADAESASYTAAQQTSDGLTPGDPVHVKIYQMSADVGRGYATDATI